MANDGIVISDSEPTVTGKVTWLKILPDGSREWREMVDGSWSLVKSESAPASADHSHPTHGDIDFTGDIKVGGVEGLTGEYEGTFKKIKVVNGIVTEFELV